MSLAYFIVLDRQTPGIDPFVDGKFLAREAGRINQVAGTLGLPLLDDFVDYNSVEELGIDLGDWEGRPSDWFTPKDGLAWVEALIAYFEARPEVLAHPSDVLADLHACREVLETARTVEARWHFAVDF